MIRRPVWLGAGVVLGVGGTLWAERRVRRSVRRVAPDRVAVEAKASVVELGGRFRGAIAAGREERDRREAELWRALRGTAARSRRLTAVPGGQHRRR